MAAGEAFSIVVNGQERRLEEELALDRFLRRLGHDPRTVAVEYNGTILRRESFSDTLLRAGDRLEIVRFVQGGRV